MMMMKYLRINIGLRASRAVSSITANTAGTAMVEFAITLPVMLMLYLSCVQVCDVVGVYRKVTTTSRTIADLTSQETSVTDGELTTILNASGQVMAPYSTSNLRMVVTHLTISNTGVATVNWSKAAGTGATADTVGATYSLPTGVGVNNTSLVVSRVNYAYLADIGGFLHTDIPLAEAIYMYPRNIDSITKS
jgi:Flp pilus assembly protein TadG